ncbi:hypothetical protein [Leptospira barantonii]|uniref:Uncharacterized protein n=1 Tax=Leptospira barantonii TaxID=2023184 RepID=A0ABX4NPA5_9LEPT|nr:hypothetical protein [Leptospira barantonii]PJZ58530.1 hypothetical protein CH367_00275 [Leptospira barantonii]
MEFDPKILREIIDGFITESATFFPAWEESTNAERPFQAERNFYSQAVKQKEFQEPILNYVRKIIDHNRNGSILWSSEEEHAGTRAVMALALFDKTYIKEYIDFLRTNDLDHEVYQSDDIQELIERWGWCEETLSLAAARSFRGQFGSDQLGEMLSDGLEEYLTKTDSIESFVERICEELRNDSAIREEEYEEWIAIVSYTFGENQKSVRRTMKQKLQV